MINISNRKRVKSQGSKRIGIVTPVFNQPKLVFEAIRSVQNQSIADEIVHVVVSDGGNLGSQFHVLSSAAANYQNLEVLFFENSGPGAARNRAIEFLLDEYGELEFVYFLDADNRLEPWAMETASRSLSRSEADWLYSDIHMLGVNEQHTVRGVYNSHHHRFQNFCDTGSMIKIDLLKQGLRFNEDRRDGYEDWGFWLSAQEMGGKGTYVEDFGLRYRRRGASRYVEEAENHDNILQLFKKRYKSSFSFQGMKQLENLEAPRFAIEKNMGDWHFSSDPFNLSARLSFAQVKQKFGSFFENPSAESFPPYIVFANEDLWRFEWGKKIVRDLFLRSDLLLRRKGVFTARLAPSNGDTFRFEQISSEKAIEVAPFFVAIKTSVYIECLQNNAEEWLFSQMRGGPDGIHYEIELSDLDEDADALRPIGLSQYGFSLLAQLKPKKSNLVADQRWDWKIRDLHRHIPSYAGWGGELDDYCRPQIKTSEDTTIAFVIKICDFGGAEKVIYNVAKQFAQKGWRVSLFLFGNKRARSPAHHFDCFENIYVFDEVFTNDAELGEWGSAALFRGETFPETKVNKNLLNSLNGFDVVVNAHSWAFNGIALELKKLGIVTATYLHLVDQSPYGRPVGHPHVALAFEYAYDLFITCSKVLRNWLSAAGVPDENLCYVQNAPGYELASPPRVKNRSSSDSRPLRVLYAGRLDRQKGIDRLETVYSRTKDWVEWRVIGKALFQGGGSSIKNLIDPIYDEAMLQKQYEWADVMVLLSDYEGVPLAILEAQRAGCVVLATDVGGVSEAIVDECNGYLMSVSDASERCVEILETLDRERQKLAEVSRNAEHSGRSTTWATTSQELLDVVASKLMQTQTAKKAS